MTPMLFEKMKTAVARYAMLPDAGGILAAFSGGPDSTAMLFALSRLAEERKIPLVAAHVHHGLRETADRDERFCRDFCAAHGIPLEVCHADVPALAAARGQGIEEVAREVRYAFFDEVLARRPELSRIATAHTAGDNAETVLFRLARGSGLRGLCGIPPVRRNVIRPLILVTRDEVMAYLAENGLSFVIDETNGDTAYARNYIRADVLPRLSALYGDTCSRISDTALRLSEDEAYLCDEAEKALDAAADGGRWRCDALAALPKPLRLRALMLAEKKVCETAPERVHLDALDRLLSETETVTLDLPGGAVARVSAGRLSFAGQKEETPPFSVTLTEGENRLPCGSVWLFTTNGAAECEKLAKVYNLFISRPFGCDRIDAPCVARSRENGDRIRFGGMTHRLKTLFGDAHIPADARARIPVICDARGVLWVPGFPQREQTEPDLTKPTDPVWIGYAAHTARKDI